MGVINSPNEVSNWKSHPSDTVKIVLGPTPGEFDKDQRIRMESLPSDFAQKFPNLTHLYLWRIEGLKSLPELPSTLQCLDVRGCKDLNVLPELPSGLKELDLGECSGLTALPQAAPSLERFYFNGCSKLKARSLENFFEALAEIGAPLIEIDASGSAIRSLDEIPRTHLKKLVAKGCEFLERVDGIASFSELEHLNVSWCHNDRFTCLPDLPPALRFLVLHGAEHLTEFLGQHVSSFDRGKENQNVADRFLTRKKYGSELAVMPHAKLLMLGDGRVGKTTLAKRLQWEELSAGEREPAGNRRPGEPVHPLMPVNDELFTHGVFFWFWKTGIRLDSEKMIVLEAPGQEILKRKDGLLDGAVRIWDFGGQRYYQHTHRVFAGEGSVFLLVWKSGESRPGDSPPGISAELWEELNRKHSLDYWLDYIFSLRSEARVAIVCTHCQNPDQMDSRPHWKSTDYRHQGRVIERFWVDSLDDQCGTQGEFQKLSRWIKEACGSESERIGLLQPRFYRHVSDLVDSFLTENGVARRALHKPAHVLFSWEEWVAQIRDVHDKLGLDVELEDSDVESITDYLHDAGHLFMIRQRSHRSVLIDHEWAAELIYELFRADGNLFKKIQRNGGWFYLVDIEECDTWEQLANDSLRARLLSFMEESKMITELAIADKNRSGQDIYLASEKYLLPKLEGELRREVENKMELIREVGGMEIKEAFEFEKRTLTEFQFRDLMVLCAGTFGTQARYFRSGLQAMENDHSPGWCFRLRWVPDSEDSYTGKIDALLVAKKSMVKDVIGRIEEKVLYAEGSPLGVRPITYARRAVSERDLRGEFFGVLPGAYSDAALSNSGRDDSEANALHAALRRAELNVKHYPLPEFRLGENRKVMEFMNSFSEVPCIILLLSESYLDASDPENRWHCAYELADAICRFADGSRDYLRTVVVIKSGSPLTRSAVLADSVRSLMTTMRDHCLGQIKMATENAAWEDIEHYTKLARHFACALANDNVGRLFTKQVKEGFREDLPNNIEGENAFEAIVDRVKKAIGRSPAE